MPCVMRPRHSSDGNFRNNNAREIVCIPRDDDQERLDLDQERIGADLSTG